MKKISAFIILLLSITSCFSLKERPTTSLTTSYGSEAALEADIRGIQQSLLFFVKDYPENLEACSGLVHFGSTSNRVEDNRWKCILTNMTFTSMSLNIEMYGAIYNGINRCNVLLSHLDESPVDAAYKAEIAAECKLYRALLYFTAVRLYGDVPLALSGYETSFEPMPRTPYYLVYDSIVSDLKEAFDGMRSPERVRMVTGTQGRPDKWAAESLLSAVYLQIASILTVPEDENFYNPAKEGRKPVFVSDGIGSDASKAWSLALETSRNVIENGPYRLAHKYSDLFKWTKGYYDYEGKDCWNLSERILVIQSTGTDAANFTATRSLPQFPPDVTAEVNWTYVSRAGNVRPSRFFFNEWCRRYAFDAGCRKDSVYVVNPALGPNDPRMDAALIYDSYHPCNNPSKTTSVYPSNVEGTSLPYFRKYLTPTYQGKPDVADFYLMRLAEVYYIAAEASAQLGRGADAVYYVNQVHERAGTPLWSSASVDDIVWDKLFELCGEGRSFFETRRYGARWFKENILDARNAFFDTMGARGEKYLTSYFGRADFRYDFADDLDKVRGALLCEFPKEELTANSAMTLSDKNDYSRE